MKNNLFNKSLLKKYAKKKAFELSVPIHDFLKTHAEKVENNDFKAERSSYLYFYDFLKEILGYDRDENILFEDKEAIGRGKVEFVLKSTDPEHKFMVIELKDQNTDLDKPQTRANDKRSPVDQAFSYAQHSDPDNPVDWIMVSNFKEFRLYNYDKRSGKCIRFTYEDLLDKEKFKYFMVAFSKQSHIDHGYPEKILKETLVIEKKLEQNFYKLFHETRLMLIKELEEINDLTREEAVHYAQLILNRYMFIAFAEDTGMLISQISTDTIITPIKKGNLRHRSIWQRLNELFLDINEGNQYKKISAYNGGLFEEDLDFINIRDTVEDQEIFQDAWQDWNFDEYEKDIKPLLEPYGTVVNPIYKNLLTISSFDFSSELDVNILGHIFENSIGDLEELKADTKGRRKKEGIFYTPSYITDYICRNTIIPYLSKSGNVNIVEELIEEYSWGKDIEELDQKLANIKIVDPACGSGAFLNKATDILLEIHEAIFDFKKGITKKTQMRVGRGKRRKTEDISHFDLGTIVFDAIEKRREILLDNIYGVDLNEESVEITKLSLFLKVCKKDKKLPALDKNIKCGNSIINDPKFTDKPFKWEDEFNEIFEVGGFDIVIGNPPWGAKLDQKSKNFIKENYNAIEYQIDTYVVFMEKGSILLKDNGFLGFIIPSTWLSMHYFKKIRSLLINNSEFENVILFKYQVFEDVTAESSIIVSKKVIPKKNHQIKINVTDNKFEFFDTLSKKVDQNFWQKNVDIGFNLLFDQNSLNLVEKIFDESIELKDIAKITSGIVPYEAGKGNPKQTKEDVKNRIYDADRKRGEDYKQYIVGRNIKKFVIIPDSSQWIRFGNCLAAPRKSLDFNQRKIVVRQTSDRIIAAIDENGYLNLKSVHNIVTNKDFNFSYEYLMVILNSRLMDFIYNYLVPELGRVFAEVKAIKLAKLPIFPAQLEEQQELNEKAVKMIKLNRKLQEELRGFQNWLKQTFNIEKLSKKLEKYYELSFDEFLNEVKKKKVDVRSRKNQELLKDEYQKSLDIINPLLQEIEETDDEIDQMVYELYGLTEEEIEIIENSFG